MNVCAARTLQHGFVFHEMLPHEAVLVTEAERERYIDYRRSALGMAFPEFDAPIVGLPKRINGQLWCQHCSSLFYCEEETT